MNEAVHGARFLGRDVLVEVEVFDLAGEMTGKGRRIKQSDGIYAGLTGQNLLPGRLSSVSHGRHTAQSGHDNATTTHAKPRNSGFFVVQSVINGVLHGGDFFSSR